MTIRTRKRLGMVAILIGLSLYAIVVVMVMTSFKRLPIWAEVPAYLVLGIIWIKPCYQLMVWIETGKWKAPKP